MILVVKYVQVAIIGLTLLAGVYTRIVHYAYIAPYVVYSLQTVGLLAGSACPEWVVRGPYFGCGDAVVTTTDSYIATV